MSNTHVKSAMDYNSIVGFLSTVQWKQVNYCRASLEGVALSAQDSSGTRKFLQSLQAPTWNFEVTVLLYFGLL